MGVFSERRKKYLESIEEGLSLFYAGMEVFYSSDAKYPFIVNKNFYYLTNLDIPEALLLLYKTNEGYFEILFIEKSDPAKEKWVGPKLSKEDAQIQSEINDVYYLDEFEEVLGAYMSPGNNNHFEQINNVYCDFSTKITPPYVTKIKEKWPFVTFFNNAMMVAKLRLCKTDDEVNNILKAIAITKEGLQQMMKKALNNCYEYELESYYDQVLKYHNSYPSFKSIVAGGINATTLHYEKNNAMIRDSLVLCDLGAVYNNYASDITRTFPINGVFTERQKAIYEVVLSVNKKSIDFLKPGITYHEFLDYGKQLLAAGLEELGLASENIDKYYYHSLGHSLGLDVHDPGNLDQELKPGMVITVEPGLYIAEEEIGVRIEDDILITENGRNNLSQDIIKEVDEIEQFMKNE